MSTIDEMGLTPEAAAGYEQFFVPAMFDQWPPKIIAIAGISDGDHVLEVGCGTGVFAREAVKHVGPNGHLVGLDLSESMLGVAREICPKVEFRQGNVMALPYDDNSFDIVVSSFILMFAPEPAIAVQEMMRVLKPKGKLVVAVWEALKQNPVYSGLCEIARERIDETASSSLAWPFALGDEGRLTQIFNTAGVDEVTIQEYDGRAKFDSLESFVTTEIKAWVLADSVDDESLANVVRDSKHRFASYCDPATGAVDIPLNAVIASLNKAR